MKQTHGDGSLSRTGWAGHEDGAASDASLLDHLEDDAGGLTGLDLTHHPLGIRLGLQSIIESQSPDVGMSTYTYNTCCVSADVSGWRK